MSKWIAGVALAVGAVALVPAPASASHVCVGVEKVGTLGPPLLVGSQCPATSGHTCDTLEVGVHPTLMLNVYFCVPR